ncbi:MAG TPA: PAS domain S-box protein, partial [Anaerolineae bacterium]
MLLGIRWGGLRAKIITWSFVPTAIILTAVALVGFYAYQQVTENLTVASSRELARLSASELAAGLTDYGDTLTALARTATLYTSDPNVQRAALVQAGNRVTIFDGGVLILDNYGKVTATQPVRPEIMGEDWSSHDYFRQMIRTPGVVYSNIVNDGPGGARVIDVAVPITNDQGEFVGTLVGMFRVGSASLSPFYGSIVRLRIGGNGAAYLTDRTGWIIYRSNGEQIDENLVWQGVERQSLGEQASALRTRDSTGQEIVASFAPVPGTPWELVIEQSWDAMLASGQSYLQSLVLLLVLGLLTPALVVTLGVRRITEPINQLIAATHQVASGNFGHKITVRTGDELAELGEQFNRMSAQLAASYEQLKAREERFELVMRGTNDGVWDWDLKTDDVYFSPRWKGMLGYADGELANRFETWSMLLHPEDVDRAQVTLGDYLEKRSPVYEIEFRMRHKDGAYRWISARAGALWDAEGKAYRMTGSHTDITERKQSEEALRQSESRFAQVFHASPVAVSITALEDGRYLDLNDAWLRLFGYERAQV